LTWSISLVVEQRLRSSLHSKSAWFEDERTCNPTSAVNVWPLRTPFKQNILIYTQAIWGSLDKPNLRVANRSVEYKVHVRDKWQPSVSPSVRFMRCWEIEAKWQKLTNLIWRWKRTFVTQYTYIYSLYFCWLWVFCMETYIYPFAWVSQNGFSHS
jgi:hypothetical protein